MTRKAVFYDGSVFDVGGVPISVGGVPDPSGVPDGRWLRTASGAAVWQAPTTADLPDSTNKRYVTDAQLVVLGNTSGVNSGDQTTVSGNAGTATKLATARNIDGQAFDGSADITVIAPGTHAATGKTTPVDADELALVDSAAANALKKLTWANTKATLKTYFDTLYTAGGGGYATVEDEGSALTARTVLDFQGVGVTATDDAGNSKTVVTISGGGGGGSDISARVFNSTSQGLTSGVDTRLAFDSERFDTDTIHDNSVNNSRLTCQTAGKYLIGANVNFAANATGNRVLYLLLNNTTVIALTRLMAVTTGATATDLAVTTLYALSATDFVEVHAIQNSGGPLNIVAAGNWSPEFWMVKQPG